MSAVNFNQQPIIAGQKIGVSPLFAALLWLIIIGLTMMNIYHIDNFLVSKLTDTSTSFLFVWILHIISVSAALLEVPLAKSIVTNYRLHGFNSNVFLQSLFTLIIASMAVIGGINSQLTDADKRDTQINSYESTLSTFDSKKRSLESARDAHKLQANNIKDKNSRAIEKARADSDYYAALSKLDYSKAGHQATRPTRAIETGSTLHWITITLFSLVCSFGVIFVSGFMAVYYQSLVSLPAFSLMSKANHAWSSSGADFVTSKHQISPLNNRMSGFAKVEKSGANQANPTPPPTTKKQEPAHTQNRPTQNRPQPAATGLGAVSDDASDTGIRTPNDAPTEGAKFRAINAKDIEEAKRAVIAGDLAPTIKPVKQWLLDNRRVGISDKDRQATAKKLLDGMHKEGILILNPEQKNTKQILAKYVLASSVKPNRNSNQEDSEQGGEQEVLAPDEMGPYEIETRCGHCGDYSYTHVAKIRERNGTVMCDGCNKGHIAASNITSSSKSINQAEKDLANDTAKRRSGVIPAAGLGVSIDENGISPTAIIGAGMVGGKR